MLSAVGQQKPRLKEPELEQAAASFRFIVHKLILFRLLPTDTTDQNLHFTDYILVFWLYYH